ncbi:TonB-dependent receptor [Nitritalea halalkaliphila LW7]|uniref:TonB-dependent receptor n=1 Tax=Nitritalea halalkaliphila LW7 TaxID=1189621 RepID=I5C376_9BACT|nr:SusC/RagA family TonB-linked outer membrane protein [Nitritalea halalkaliphila]EIM76278.1 TonB-dependent receptor [Nitritalea halalkaliphila LW7]
MRKVYLYAPPKGGLLFSFLLLVCCFMGTLQAQNAVTISGKVSDARTGEELIGATISIQGTSIGAVTDLDGRYALSTTLGQESFTLVVRAIGYSSQNQVVTLGNQSAFTFDFELTTDVMNLDEVIITGASAATSRRQLGNAVSTVSSRDLAETGGIAVDQALQGKIAGALVQQNSGDPAGGISVRLRGTSTITGSSDPLYIIDGVLVNNNSNELVDIGGAAQNRLVDINPADIERIEVLKGAAAAAIYGSRASNGVVQIYTKRGKVGKPRFSFSTAVRVNELRKQIPFNEVPFDWVNPGDRNNLETFPVERFNLQDEIFRRAGGTENNLSVSGGSDKTTYFASVSYLNNGGIVKNTNFERIGARLNVDQTVSDWLKFSFGLNYTRSESQDMPNGGINAVDGAITGFLFSNNRVNPRPNASGVFPVTSLLVPRTNPAEAVARFDYGQRTNRVITNFTLNANPSEKWNITYILGLDYYNQSAFGFIPVGNTSSNALGWATRGDANVTQFNNDLNISYETMLTPAIRSTTIAGGTWQQDNFERIGITSDRLAPTVRTAVGGTIISAIDVRSDVSYYGAFVQQTFGIKEKLFVTGALRYDGASVFGPEEKIQSYGKGSVSYNLSEENFFKETFGSRISNFKLRASYGQAGNLTAIGAFDRFLNYNPLAIGGLSAVVPSTLLGNDALAPEIMNEFEYGIDASFFGDRLGFEFTVFNQQITDLLLQREVATSTGFATRFENVGKMENRGIELLVRANVMRNRDFNWDVTTTFTTNRNEVTQVVGDRIILPGSFGTSAVIEGQPIGVFFQGFYDRDDAGNIRLDANGLPRRGVNPDGTNVRVIGDPNPDWFGSVINDFSYKNFTFRVQFDAVWGFDVFNWNRRLLDNAIFGGGENAGRELLGEIPKGTGGVQAGIFEEFVEDGSFVKLRELAIGYNYRPKSGAIQNVRFNLVGRNLISFDSYSGWDPEVNTPGQSNGVRGFDFGAVPIPRTIQLGVNLSF